MDQYLTIVKNKILIFWRRFITIASENERRTLIIAASLVVFVFLFQLRLSWLNEPYVKIN